MDEASGVGLVDVLKVLTLEQGEPSATGLEQYVGLSSPQPHGRVFGGQVLAQALMAAGATLPQGRPVHSMHGYFLRPGDLDVPITFAVDRLRDGASFSARRVQAVQHDGPLLSMIASFQEPADGVDHGTPMPDVPSPDKLPATADLMAGIDHPVARYWAQERPIDIRHIDHPIYFEPAAQKFPVQRMWMRCMAPIGDDDAVHRAVLAYASDYTLLEPVLRNHGFAWATPGFKAASLDHAMWWHRPFRADEWVLCVQESPSATSGRGLTEARFFTPDGAHVATVCQELMFRPPAPHE